MGKGKSIMTRFVLMVFAVVAIALEWIARRLHVTYNEINVIVYYWLIPLSWTLLIDWKLDATVEVLWYHGFFPVLSFSLMVAWIGILIATFRLFGSWCDFVFKASQDFLCVFNRWGGNYELNSVIICVVIPVIVYIVLWMM